MKTDKGIKPAPPLFLSPNILLIVCVAVAAILFVAIQFIPVTQGVMTFVYIACVTLVIYDMLIEAVMKLIRYKNYDENLLIVIGAIGLLILGEGLLCTAAVLVYKAGIIIYTILEEKSAEMFERVVDVRPMVVNAIDCGAVMQKSVGKIEVGDVIAVASGEYIALDGIVIGGASVVDNAALTGDTAQMQVSPGSPVHSGSMNRGGNLNIEVTATFDHSFLSHVIKHIDIAENRKSKTEKSIASLARVYMPAIVAIAIITGLLVPIFGALEFKTWLIRAFGLLFISGLGALLKMIPLTYLAGITGAVKKGILYKGSDVVEILARTTSVIFEKTGILTTGHFKVTDVQAYGISEEKLLMLAAYAELRSEHPMAQAIVEEADIDTDFSKITGFRSFAGRGTEVDVAGLTVSAGNARFMEELGITPDISQNESSVVYIAVNRKYAGRILLSDTIKPDAQKAVRDLRAIGIDRLALFTGDKYETAGNVAGKLAIREFYAECIPDDKAARIKGLHDMQLKGDRLIFVGDGKQDAAVMKAADAGVVLRGLNELSTAGDADMVIMSDDPSKIAEAIVLARSTNEIIRLDILLTLGIKALTLLLMLFGAIPAWLAVLADVCLTSAMIVYVYQTFGKFGAVRRKRRIFGVRHRKYV